MPASAKFAAHRRRSLHRDTFAHQRQYPLIAPPPCLPTRLCTRPHLMVRQFEGVGLLEAYVAPKRNGNPSLYDQSAHSGQQCWRQGLVGKVEAAYSGLCHYVFHAFYDYLGRRSVVTADIVERGVAESAFLVIAPVRYRHFVPSAVAP